MQTKIITKTLPWGGKVEYEVNELEQRHGKYKYWSYKGNKIKECTYQNDKRHGLYKRWYSNGKTKIFDTNKKDQIFGTRVEFRY